MHFRLKESLRGIKGAGVKSHDVNFAEHFLDYRRPKTGRPYGDRLLKIQKTPARRAPERP